MLGRCGMRLLYISMPITSVQTKRYGMASLAILGTQCCVSTIRSTRQATMVRRSTKVCIDVWMRRAGCTCEVWVRGRIQNKNKQKEMCGHDAALTT
jgi:hypothetical protein